MPNVKDFHFILRGSLPKNQLYLPLSLDISTVEGELVVFKFRDWTLTWNTKSAHSNLTLNDQEIIAHTTAWPFGRKNWIHEPDKSVVTLVLTKVIFCTIRCTICLK